VHGVPVFRLRGNLLPLVLLRDQLGLDPADPDEGATIVVLTVRDRLFGLVVDAVHNTEEIVVKPLSRQLKPIPLYAGATIMGDGKVALILDVMGIAQRSRVVSDVRAPDGSEYAGTGRRVAVEPTVPVVLVEGFGGQRQALTLQWVSRLEQLPRAALERAGGRTVVQYDGEILPLVELDELVGGPGDDGRAAVLPTVICREGERTFGLVVRRIVDVVELPDRIVRVLAEPGAEPVPLVAEGRVTELLAVGPAVRAARPDLFGPAASGATAPSGPTGLSSSTEVSAA
jgi:two-component system chemotaxis sensor kinase CheA